MALVIGAFVCLRALKSEDQRYVNWILLGIGIWPLIFPSWFTDMARIGNDSLCALIISLLWMLLIRFKNQQTRFSYLLFGFLLGIGCLVKAFFIPIVAGVVSYLLISDWVKQEGEKRKFKLLQIPSMIFVILSISGWWYYMNWIDYGVVLGSDEMIRLKNAGGLFDNLINNFSFSAWIRGHAAAITTFAWSGSWSFARPHYIFLGPMALMVVYFFYIYISNLRRYQIHMIEWLPVWFTLPVLLGLSYHVLVRISLIGEGRGTGGYYLHFLVVPLIMALGIGLQNIQTKKGLKLLTGLFSGYALIFSMTLFYAQILLYSGRLHISGESKFYQLSTNISSLFEISAIFSSLNVISYPYLGIFMLLCGGVFVVLGLKPIWERIASHP
jgi:4-amino-4-deoxy-L-arabinose transferase-like glycosyltransferase